MLEVFLTTPSHYVSFKDGYINVAVKVKAAVKSSVIGTGGFSGTLNVACDDEETLMFYRSLRIEDETVLNIDFRRDLKLTSMSDPKNYNLDVEFVHDATNKTFGASTSFSVEISEYDIGFVNSPQFFKPGIPYSFTALVRRIDGYPVLNSELPLEVEVTDDDGFLLVHGNYSLDPHTGSVEVNADGISITAAYLQITAKYDKVNYSEIIYKTSSAQKNFLSLIVLTPR